MRVRVVPELGDLRVPVQRGLDDAALDTTAAAMHETDLEQTGRRKSYYKDPLEGAILYRRTLR